MTPAIASIASCVLSAAVTSASRSGRAETTMLLLARTCEIEPAERLGHRLVDLARGRVQRDQQRLGRRDRPVRHRVAGAQRFGHRICRSAERTDRCGEAAGAFGAVGMERLDPRLDFAEPGVEIVDDPLTRTALQVEADRNALDRIFDGGDAAGERFGTVACGAVECRLVRADHRQHRVALCGDTFACFVDRVGGAVEQRVDRAGHAIGDRFEMRARGLAGRLHADDMRGEALRRAAGHRIGLTTAFGERDDLRVESGGVFARRQTGAFEALGDVVDIRLRAGESGDQDAEAGLRAGGRGREIARVRGGLVDFGDHAATDRRKLLGRAAAHRHQRVELLCKLRAVCVDGV
ncbi:hypothetical protein QP179_03080 [Sphingomonas aurantiaca]|uniref:hypothetical protein n=1 Tax=Sphingomonas aurantiaca TaxID=185949 RepID=UPI002FE2268C